MDYQYLSAFLRFIRREYSNEAAYGRWCSSFLMKIIRAENPMVVIGWRLRGSFF